LPFDYYKIKLVDVLGRFLGYRCELCGWEIYVEDPRHAKTASSALTNHIKARHPKEYEKVMGHPPIWRYKDWELGLDGKWRKKSEEGG